MIINSKPVFRKAVIKSLKWTTAHLVIYMGPQAEDKGIISKLETVYGIVAIYKIS